MSSDIVYRAELKSTRDGMPLRVEVHSYKVLRDGVKPGCTGRTLTLRPLFCGRTQVLRPNPFDTSPRGYFKTREEALDSLFSECQGGYQAISDQIRKMQRYHAALGNALITLGQERRGRITDMPRVGQLSWRIEDSGVLLVHAPLREDRTTLRIWLDARGYDHFTSTDCEHDISGGSATPLLPALVISAGVKSPSTQAIVEAILAQEIQA